MGELKKVRHDLGALGGIEAESVNTMAIAKQIRILEDRLNAGLQKFIIAIAANKKLRDEIDTLRRERAVFDDIYRKLENELQQKKKEMANIIEQANAAYEARDSAQAQMAALKQQADKEHAEFEKEWTELGRLIENDKKMKEFMRQRHRQQDSDQRGDLSADQEDKMKKKVTASAWGIAKDKATINTHIEKIQSYEEAFAKIQAATGISDVDELVQNFIDGEDQNFTVFNFTTGQNDEVEKLEQQIQDYKTELEKLRSLVAKAKTHKTSRRSWQAL